jgi:hypothetical protein
MHCLRSNGQIVCIAIRKTFYSLKKKEDLVMNCVDGGTKLNGITKKVLTAEDALDRYIL